MRAGFVTQLLWSRYGPFWEKMLADIGAEVVFPDAARTLKAFESGRFDEVPAAAFRMAAAQAAALADVDVLVVPDLNPGEDVPRGGGQDPWIASFPEALAKTVGGLPQTAVVPADLGPGLERVAVETLHLFSRDPGNLRRVWERSRSLAKLPRQPEPRWQPGLGQTLTVGLVGQPWLLAEPLFGRVQEEGSLLGRLAASKGLEAERVHVVSQHELEPELLRREGAQVDGRLVGTDREVLGAARYLGRKGGISELAMIADRDSGADLWLAGRVERSVHKPFRLVYLDELAPGGDVGALLAAGS